MIEIGSDEHKKRFCRQFVASHRRYRPESLAWPELDTTAHQRLRAIPFWPEVLFTERRAGAIVDAYAAKIADPALLRPRLLPSAGGLALAGMRLAAARRG
jgi:hypothetical protein